MSPTSHESKASEPVFFDHPTTIEGLEMWQTVMSDAAKFCRKEVDRSQVGMWSWIAGSSPTPAEKHFGETLATCYESLATFAEPGQTPAGYQGSLSKVEDSFMALGKTVGYEDIDKASKIGLNRAKLGIEFGAIADICNSNYGHGAPIACTERTVELVGSYFKVGSIIPGFPTTPKKEEARKAAILDILTWVGSQNPTLAPYDVVNSVTGSIVPACVAH